MATLKNTATRATASYPVDDRFLLWTGTVFRPYVDVAEANATIKTARRHKGLAVCIDGEYYIYKNGITDSDLIPLTTAANGGRTVESFTKATGNGTAFSYTLPAFNLIEKILLKVAVNCTTTLRVDGNVIESRDVVVSTLGDVFASDVVAYDTARTITFDNLAIGAIIIIIKQKIS